MEHVVLHRSGKTALVFMQGHAEEFAIANHYYGLQEGWGFGNYFSSMEEAVIAYFLQIAREDGMVKEEVAYLKDLVKRYSDKK